MIDALLKYIPIYVESIENQIREKKFPNKIEYLEKVRKLNAVSVPSIQTSFFQGIRLFFKAKKCQFLNNASLLTSIISIVIYGILNVNENEISYQLWGLPIKNIFFIITSLSFLLSVVLSFYFNALRSTSYKLFGEIDLYETKTKTRKPASNDKKPNGTK